MLTRYRLVKKGATENLYESENDGAVWVDHEVLCPDCTVVEVDLDEDDEVRRRYHDNTCPTLTRLVFEQTVQFNADWANEARTTEEERRTWILLVVARARARGKVIRPNKRYRINALDGEIISGAELLEFMRAAIEYGNPWEITGAAKHVRKEGDDRASM